MDWLARLETLSSQDTPRPVQYSTCTQGEALDVISDVEFPLGAWFLVLGSKDVI